MFKPTFSLRQTLSKNRNLSLFVSITILIVISGSTFSAFLKVSGENVGNKSAPANSQNGISSCPTCSQPAARTIYAPTIGVPEAAGSTIVLNCRSTNVMQATPTFYTANGTAIVGDVIHLQPAEIRFVEIESLIPPQHRGQHVWGGMSISYVGAAMEVWAQITLKGAGNRGSADVTFSVLNNLGSDIQEAVWWQPTPGIAIIALGNSSNSPIQTTVQFSDGDTQSVNIAPFATNYIRRNYSNNANSKQSVKLTNTGPQGSLKAVGYVTSSSNSNNRFASSVRFYEPQGVVQPKLFANNLRVKNSELHLV